MRKTSKKREYFTPGKLAQLLMVGEWAVAQWLQSGELVSHEVPSRKGVKRRRVHWQDLAAFMQAHDMRQALVRFGLNRAILVLGAPDRYASAMDDYLPPPWDVYHAQSPVQAGCLWVEQKPLAVVIDWRIGEVYAHETAQWLATRMPRPRLIALVSRVLTQEQEQKIRRYGWDEIFLQPISPGDLVAMIVKERPVQRS